MGTDLALCTKSSSLSISTRTSIASPSSSASQLFLQPFRDLLRDEIVDPAPERRELLHATRGQKTVLRAGHQVNRLYSRVLSPVQLVHLQLVLEVRDRTQPLHDRLGSRLPRELDDEVAERLRAHTLQRGDRALDEGHPLVDPKQRLVLAHRAIHDSHDNFVVQDRSPANHIQMTVRDRVIRARTHHDRLRARGHRWSPPAGLAGTRACPAVLADTATDRATIGILRFSACAYRRESFMT